MTVTPAAPTIEHHREPLGIGEPEPRISWKTAGGAEWSQTAYELESVIGDETLTTGRIDSIESVLVPWPARPLTSREIATVRVRVWGDAADSAPSAWSPATTLEIGLLQPRDWSARPVGGAADDDPESDTRRPPIVRRAFTVAEHPVRARLYVSAHGLYEAELNGRRVGNEAMAPGWTVYGSRLRYATYDVTDSVVIGENAIGGWLGDGWYRGRLGWNGGFHNLYGDDIGLIAQLELTFADGSTQTVATDASWRWAPSPILASGNYDGETYDARDERAGWSSPGFDDSDWSPVRVGQRDAATLEAPVGPPVRCTEEVTPVAVLDAPSGAKILDLGQNLAGRLRIRVRGQRGTTVRMATAEVLQDGEIYQRPLRSALSTDTYTLAGSGDEAEEWEPRFTWHGFRYVQVDGWPGDLSEAIAAGDIVARVLHTDMERTGWFECSDPLVDKLHQNVVWGMRSNFLDVPTDCPQRDERAGWTGDLQVFAPTASFLYDCSGMLDSWLRDVAIEQLPDGTVPWYVPVIPAKERWTPIFPGALWGDVSVLTPWTLYERFGDAGILHRQYPSAKAWVDLVDSLAGDDHLWNEGFQLGDWLDPDAPPQDPADAKTDRYLVATAYFAWSALHLSRIAGVLGLDADAEHYATLATQVRDAFIREYESPDGRLSSDAQTAYALAIRFGLVPAETLAAAGDRLSELVSGAHNRISTGFAGTPAVSDALSMTGHDDTAYDLLLERECPSWLYAITMGATTVWERWDSLRPDGTVNPGTMTSFNHYALGAVADWMHRVIAGIAPAEPGYRRIEFRPRPGGGITSASARHETPYGTASIAWRLADDRLTVDTVVPSGCSATLDIAGHDPVTIGPGARSQTFTTPAAGPAASATSA